MKRLKAAKRLRYPADVKLFVQILVTILMLPGAIRRKSLPELLKDIDPGVSVGPRDEAIMMRTVKSVDLLLGFKPLLRYGKCFLRSLTLFKFLRRQGWPVSIYFGVRKTGEPGDAITGHSWLVLDGKPFLEPPDDEQFATTFHYPDEVMEAGAPRDQERYNGLC